MAALMDIIVALFVDIFFLSSVIIVIITIVI